MKYKQIILFFVVALPTSIALRLIQLFHIVETNTGFYKQGLKNWGGYITLIILAVALVLAVFSLFSHRSPEKPPKVNLCIGLASGLLASAFAIELYFGFNTFGTVLWQKILLYILGIASVLWLTVFSIKDFINIPLPNLTAIIPALFFILKIICSFAGISSLALISDNVLLITAYCAVLLFMLQFAKLYNNVGKERGFRKLLATGLASSVLCFTQSVPNIVFHVASENGYLHTAMVTNFSMFFTGLFIVTFVFTHFSKKNIER